MARMNDEAGAVSRADARGVPQAGRRRSRRAQDLLEKIEPHQHAVGVCSRCDTVVEPMLSDQWFVRVTSRDGAIEARSRRCATARTTFHPKCWENTYFSTGWKYPRLVHLAPALVGPSHSGLLVRALRDAIRSSRRSARPTCCEVRRRRPASGRGRARHLVLARGCGRSRPSDGPTRRPSSNATIRPAC